MFCSMIMEMFEGMYSSFHTGHSSMITEVFEGLLESRVRCSECKKVSVTKETFQDLSLPIPGQHFLTFSLPLSSSFSPIGFPLSVSVSLPSLPPSLRGNYNVVVLASCNDVVVQF